MNKFRFLSYKQIFRQFQSSRILSQQAETSQPKPITYLTEDEKMMKETAARFATEKIAPLVRKMEQEKKLDNGLVASLFENGLMGIEIGEEYGGTGANFMSAMLVVEEISKVDPTVAVLVDIHNTLINNFMRRVASDEQKKKYLPLLASSVVSSIGISEPSAGTDAFSMKTVAKKDGSDYILNGSKMWISNSDIAGIFLIMANANPSAGYKGITCFLVERDMPGFTVGKVEDKLGIVASGTCTLHLDNVRVPESNVIGKVGEAYKYIGNILNEGRIGIAAQMLGLAQGCFDLTIPYTLERQQFGKPIFSFQGMQHQIAQIATEIENSRLITYQAARMLDNGEEIQKIGAMAKYYVADVAQRTTIKCIDWMGGVGFTKDFPQEKFYRDCKIGSIYEGASNIQLTTIAKNIEREFKQR